MEQYDMQDYGYLQKLNNDEFVRIIDEMIDLEEVAEAFCILRDRNTEKALELGTAIIEQDKGDEYLQASIWNFMFFEHPKELVCAADKRENEIGRALLDDMIMDLTDSEADISRDFLCKIMGSTMLWK